MKHELNSLEDLSKLPPAAREHVCSLLAQPLRFGDSEYVVQSVVFDDGLNEAGDVTHFPRMRIEAVFLTGRHPGFAPAELALADDVHDPD
jgi:hypothetical protein